MNDTDTINMNDASHDKKEWFEAKRKEHQAHAEKMDAEKRMEANNAFNDLSAEFDAATDWTDAAWDEFTAKVSALWNEGEVKADHAI